jgi:amino acid transporter
MCLVEADNPKLEYIYKKPAFMMTSMFGILFIVLGSLAGNAVAFGIYVMIAAGKDPIDNSDNNYQKGPVIGLAISVMTICCLFHISTRRGGILINNAFAVAKVGILVVIAIIGFVHAGGKYLRSSGINQEPPVLTSGSVSNALNITSAMINNATASNFDRKTSFESTGDVSNFVQSLLFAIYPFTGFEQPFYVLSEVAQPKKVFPKAAITAMMTTIVLYMLVNISYFCVIPKESYTEVTGTTIDMATAFFYDLFGPGAAPRAMAALVAFSIFGNILVLTFTAARVKQEIAKEGILPFSLFFATGKITPWARFRNRSQTPAVDELDFENHLEETPMAALVLHWFSSIFLILVTAMLKPSVAYSFLVTLYSYVNVAVLGLLTGGGLLYLKIDYWTRGEKGRDWGNKTQWKPWLDPLPTIIYAFSMAFLLVASFVRPATNSAFSDKVTEYMWFLVPAIGISSLLWGVVWWFGLELKQWHGRYRIGVMRTPFLERDSDGNYVQKVELVEHERLYKLSRGLRRRDHEEPRE